MVRRFLEKFQAAFSGIKAGILYDRSILLQVLMALASVGFFVWLKIDSNEWLFVISAIFIVLITEFLNSAIEDLCDLMIRRHNFQVKRIKDIAAAAVLLAAFYAITIAIIIVARRVL